MITLKKERKKDLTHIENYLRNGTYPEYAKSSKGTKTNFRRASKKFSISNGQFLYQQKRLVVVGREEQLRIIEDIHVGLGDDPHAKAMASHRGRETTYNKLMERFYWHNMVQMVVDFIKTCEECQRHGKVTAKISPELQSIAVPNKAMHQVGVDICQLPQVDGFRYLVVLIDYFTKWSEAKPLKEKSAPAGGTISVRNGVPTWMPSNTNK